MRNPTCTGVLRSVVVAKEELEGSATYPRPCAATCMKGMKRQSNAGPSSP